MYVCVCVCVYVYMYYLTVKVGYFKKCVTFLQQYLRFCETIIIFEERKGRNFKEWQWTSLYLNSKINKSKLNMAVLSHWQTTARLLEDPPVK